MKYDDLSDDWLKSELTNKTIANDGFSQSVMLNIERQQQKQQLSKILLLLSCLSAVFYLLMTQFDLLLADRLFNIELANIFIAFSHHDLLAMVGVCILVLFIWCNEEFELG